MSDYQRPLGQRIPKFCQNLGIGTGHFYKLRREMLKAGRPDPITKVGRTSIVTNEGEQRFLKALAENQAEWQRRMAEEVNYRRTNIAAACTA
jgi:hypothetical protein